MLTLYGFNGDPNKAGKIAQADIQAGMLGVIVGRTPFDGAHRD